MVTESLLRSPSGVRSFGSFDKVGVDLVSYDNIQYGIIVPWNPCYRFWWYVTALSALLTAFLVPYQIAFEEDPGFFKQSADLLERVLTFIFTVDMAVNFNLAFFQDDEFVCERRQIARAYLSFMFWVDAVGVVPFRDISYILANQMGATSETILVLSLLQLSRLIRLYRIKKLFQELRNNVCVNLLTFTLLRNFSVVVVACHVQACIMYFLARAQHFGEDTWLGPILYESESSFERYVTSLYWVSILCCRLSSCCHFHHLT